MQKNYQSEFITHQEQQQQPSSQQYQQAFEISENKALRKSSKKSRKRKLSSSSSDEDRYYSRRSTAAGCCCCHGPQIRTNYGCTCGDRVVTSVVRPRRSYSVARVETLPVDDYCYSSSYVPIRSSGYLDDYHGSYRSGYSGYGYGYGRYRGAFQDDSLLSSSSWRSRYPYYSGYYGSSYWKNYYPYHGHSRYYDDYYTPYWRSYSPYHGKYSSYLSGSTYNNGYYEGLRDSTLGYRRQYYL